MVSENKVTAAVQSECIDRLSLCQVLCHPSSVDSISTSGAKEDHVSMGGFSARKVRASRENL